MTPSPPNPERNTFLRGFGLVLLLHLALVVASFGMVLFLIGLLQLAYVIPFAIKARKQHETARLQGILVAAGITILLNGACYAFILTDLK
jgi:hypothetical protein